MPDPTTDHACVHCGLPVPAARRRGDQRAAEFCCVGCRVVHELGSAGGEDEGKPNTLLLRLGLGIFLAMNIMAFTGFFYAQQVYDASLPAGIEPHYTMLASLFAYLMMFLFTLVALLVGAPLLLDAWDGLRRRRIDANLLILIGVAAAFAVSAMNTLRGHGPVYYETAAMILVLVTLGGFLDSRAKQQAAVSANELVDAMPTRAWVRRSGAPNADVIEMDANELRIGDIVRVRPGERAAVDGVVIEGASHVNESMITGESNPRAVEPGGRVLAGSVCIDGQLWIEARAVGADRVAARIRELLAQARRQQPAIQRIADRVSAVFVPVVTLLAVIVFAYRAWHGDAPRGLFDALSVLLISCPCALGLAAPMATWSAMTRAAKRGILITSAAVLEKAARVRAVIFDKTGTLTYHEMTVTQIRVAPGITDAAAIRIAAAVEVASVHPVAGALLREAKRLLIPLPRREGQGEGRAHDFPLAPITSGSPTLPLPLPEGEGSSIPTTTEARAIPGRGVEALIDGKRYRVGSPRLMEETGADCPAELAASPDESLIYLMDDARALACFTLAERVRDDAPPTLAALRRDGLSLRVLTGDQSGPARRLSSALHIPVRAHLMPADKLDRVTRLHRRYPHPIAFVGDGINDGPALAASDIGIAVGGATDLAKQAGHVHLMSDRLDLVPQLFAIARDTMQRIRLNLFWAFGYNAIGITLAAMGLLTPIFAASTMVVSSLLIVMTSRRAGVVAFETDAAKVELDAENRGAMAAAAPTPLPLRKLGEGRTTDLIGATWTRYADPLGGRGIRPRHRNLAIDGRPASHG